MCFLLTAFKATISLSFPLKFRIPSLSKNILLLSLSRIHILFKWNMLHENRWVSRQTSDREHAQPVAPRAIVFITQEIIKVNGT